MSQEPLKLRINPLRNPDLAAVIWPIPLVALAGIAYGFDSPVFQWSLELLCVYTSLMTLMAIALQDLWSPRTRLLSMLGGLIGAIAVLAYALPLQKEPPFTWPCLLVLINSITGDLIHYARRSAQSKSKGEGAKTRR